MKRILEILDSTPMHPTQRAYALAKAAHETAEAAAKEEKALRKHEVPIGRGSSREDIERYVGWSSGIDAKHKVWRYFNLLCQAEEVLVEWFRDHIRRQPGYKPEIEKVWENWRTLSAIREKLVDLAFRAKV